MITMTSYISFFILVLTIVYCPGPMTMFMMANSIKLQYRNVWPILIGANNAYLVSIIIFAAGLTPLLQRNIYILKAVQVLGVIYLVYLAYKQWYKDSISEASASLEAVKKSLLYRKGAFIALSNPKAIILFAVIFPQFIEPGQYRLLQVAILGATFLVLQFSSGLVYAYFGKSIKGLMDKPYYQHLLNKISAFALVMVAGFLLVKL